MFSELASSYRGALGPLSIQAPASDRAAWEALPAGLKKRLIEAAERLTPFSYPPIRARDYLEFSRSGNRVAYEELQFTRRTALDAFVLAECAEHSGRFLDDILDGLYAICGEAAWQLPPHNSYIRDTPSLPLPDTTRPVLDLFAAETGAVLATTAWVMADELDAVSPFVRTMVADVLQRRIFTPYLTQHFWWMGDGKSQMNNWTVWCTQNVLIAAALTPMEEAQRRSIFDKACRSIDYFLDEYGEDGCCDEGAQYFRHAGLCLFNCLEVLNGLTDGFFAPLWQQPKIRNIAAYIGNVHVAGPYYVNFADCSPVAGRCNAREFLFALRTGQPWLAAFAAEDFRESEDPLLLQEHNLFYRLQTVFCWQQMTAYQADPAPARNLYYPSAGLFIARDDRFCLAVKGGCNGDSHNHNDTGSFTLYKDGQPLFIDVGVETYQQKTFSPRRYEIWTMQSQFHNLPTFLGPAPEDASVHPCSYAAGFADSGLTGSMQCDGRQYAASDVSCSLAPEAAWISLELAGAYPDSRIRSFRRFAELKEGRVRITDAALCPGLLPVLSLMTYEEPHWEEAEATLRVGTLAACRLAGASQVKVTRIPITDPRLRTAWKHDIWRTLVWFENELTLEIE